MNQKEGNKKWIVKDGLLCFESDSMQIVPSADEIYSAVFEDVSSKTIGWEDVSMLKKNLTFSRYPAELYIQLESTSKQCIWFSVYAKTPDNKQAEVRLEDDGEHMIIEDTWFPFLKENKDEILKIMNATGISHIGEINLGQYLSLLKISGELIKNNVLTTDIKSFSYDSDEPPTYLTANLYPYQERGLMWLRFMTRERIGGILADEMGLGKTLQIIALIASEASKSFTPSLIITPTTLLENWKREFKRFAPAIAVHIHSGSDRTGFPGELKKRDVVITSYDTIVRDISLFNQIKWKLVICDEAQAIKNPETKRAVAIKSVPKEVGFAVTGTPVENNLLDLWSIIDFAVPGFLGSRRNFENLYQKSPDGPGRLETLISPLILRRKVAEVADDLPDKIIISQVLKLSDNEIREYEKIREFTLAQGNTNMSLATLVKLRLFCAHPFLVLDNERGDPALCSNKYSRLVEIVEEIVENDAKVIVFTSFNKMNDIITSDLSQRFNIHSYAIDGRTLPSNRQKIVDSFSDDNGPAILVLNPVAAGTGLNITAASHVIHYNLEWNPAKEDQASARAYRKGQTKPVTIHRLFYVDTVEEAVNERLNRKRELSERTIIGTHGDEDGYTDILNAINKSPKHE